MRRPPAPMQAALGLGELPTDDNTALQTVLSSFGQL
jgi:hypothetical protein